MNAKELAIRIWQATVGRTQGVLICLYCGRPLRGCETAKEIPIHTETGRRACGDGSQHLAEWMRAAKLPEPLEPSERNRRRLLGIIRDAGYTNLHF